MSKCGGMWHEITKDQDEQRGEMDGGQSIPKRMKMRTDKKDSFF